MSKEIHSLLMPMATLTSPCLCRFTTFLGSSLRPSPARSFNNIRVHPSFPICLTTRKLSSSMSLPSSHPSPSNIDPPTAGNNNDVLVQYVVLRRDLIDKWPLGSVVTQGCHASLSAVWSHKDDPHTLQYCSPENLDSMHKVTLEVKGEAQILNLSEKLSAGDIAHKLWIEQPENIPTCLATKPYPKSLVSSFFKKLKLSLLKQLELFTKNPKLKMGSVAFLSNF